MRRDISRTIGQPNFLNENVRARQSAKNLFNQMRRAEYNSRDTSKKLVPFFKGASNIDTCKKVYNFLRHGMIYKKEPLSRQTAKEIKRYIADGFGDCKHYAITAVGILNACGIPAWFTLVSQSKFRPAPNHAYCCALVGNEVVVIDPCRATFNTECSHYYKYDLSPKI